MKCFSCKEETLGREHNDRGVFCTFCMARLPLIQPEPKVITVEEVIKVNPAISEIDLSPPGMVVVGEEPPRLPFIEPETTAVIEAKPKNKRRPRKVTK